jgi:tight adherence protein B
MVELAALTLAAGIVVAFVGLTSVMGIDRTLAGRLQHYAITQAAEVEVERTGRRRTAIGTLARRINRALRGRSFVASLQADLARANLKVTAGEFLLFQGGLTFGLMLIGYDVVAVVAGPNPLALPIFGLIGFVLPKFWLLRRAGARLRAFNDQLPDTLTLMANALRSGMSLLQAMDMVAREGNPPISEEFARVVREIGFGLAPEEALLHLKQRIGSDDVALLVTAMNVNREVGGNLATLLDGLAGAIRERVELKGEINTLTAQQRISAYVLAGMPLVAAGLLLLLNPKYITGLFQMPYLIMPIVGAISVFLGFIVIKKIINGIEV